MNKEVAWISSSWSSIAMGITDSDEEVNWIGIVTLRNCHDLNEERGSVSLVSEPAGKACLKTSCLLK